MMAKTAYQRVAAYRARKRERGESEVRGIYAPKDHHEAIRQFASRLAGRNTAKQAPQVVDQQGNPADNPLKTRAGLPRKGPNRQQ